MSREDLKLLLDFLHDECGMDSGDIYDAIEELPLSKEGRDLLQAWMDCAPTITKEELEEDGEARWGVCPSCGNEHWL